MMITIFGITLSPILAIIGVVVVAFLAIGLLRLLVRLAWHLVGIALTLVIVAGIILFLLNAIHIK